jgi:uncharacterized protein (UPF0335 family)
MKFSFATMFLISFKLLAQSTPTWVNSPAEYCSSQEFCAVGEAAGALAAETAAVNGIARVFNTKVSGTTNIQTSMSKDKVEEHFAQNESLSTEKILLGVEIKERFKDASGQNFALAVLKKQKARALVEEEIKKAEEEVLNLIENPKLSKVLKAKKVLANLAPCLQDFVTITGQSYAPKIKLSDLERLERKLSKNQSIYLEVSKSFDPDLKHAVIAEVLNNGWKVSANPNKDQYELKLELQKKNLHLKVEGFIKVAFETSLQTEIHNKKVGSVSFKSEQSARSEEQAQYQHNEDFKKYLSENFYRLNLD